MKVVKGTAAPEQKVTAYGWMERQFFARQVPRNWAELLHLYCSFAGRLGRVELALRGAILLAGLFCLLLGFAFCLWTFTFFESAVGAIVLLGLWLGFWILWAICAVSLTVRRLHDLNQPGWWAVLFFVPLVNMAFYLYLLLCKGWGKDNQYGPFRP